MKKLMLVALFAAGCASSSGQVQDQGSVPLEKTQDEYRWPTHFSLAVKSENTNEYGIMVPCAWRLDFKREGTVYRVSGADAYPDLKRITSRAEFDALVSDLACLMPAFTIDARTMEVVDVEVMSCVADLRIAFTEYFALVKPPDEVQASAEAGLDVIFQYAHQNFQLFAILNVPSPPYADFREDEVQPFDGGATTMGKMTRVAGHECLPVNVSTDPADDPESVPTINKLALAQGREPVSRAVVKTSIDICFSSQFFLNLKSGLDATFEEPAWMPGIKVAFSIEDFETLAP